MPSLARLLLYISQHFSTTERGKGPKSLVTDGRREALSGISSTWVQVLSSIFDLGCLWMGGLGGFADWVTPCELWSDDSFVSGPSVFIVVLSCCRYFFEFT